VVTLFNKEWIGVPPRRAWDLGSVEYFEGVGSLYTFDVEGGTPMFEGREGEVKGGK
jgi:hypothetical protein